MRDISIFAHLVYRKNGKVVAEMDVRFAPLPDGHPTSSGDSAEAYLKIFERDTLSKLDKYAPGEENALYVPDMHFATRNFRYGDEKGFFSNAYGGKTYATTASGIGYSFVAKCKTKDFSKFEGIFDKLMKSENFVSEIMEHVEDYAFRGAFPEAEVKRLKAEEKKREETAAAEMESEEIGEIIEELVSFVRDSHSKAFPKDEGYPTVGEALESFFSDYTWGIRGEGEDIVFSGVALYGDKKAKFDFFLDTEGSLEDGLFVYAKKILVNGIEVEIRFEDVLAQIYLK